MAINVSIEYNGGFLPDMIDTVDAMLLPSGNPFKCHEEVLAWQPIFPPKRFDIFSPSGGCSEGLDASIFLFEHHSLFLTYIIT